jgi:hypothetical protein
VVCRSKACRRQVGPVAHQLHGTAGGGSLRDGNGVAQQRLTTCRKPLTTLLAPELQSQLLPVSSILRTVACANGKDSQVLIHQAYAP